MTLPCLGTLSDYADALPSPPEIVQYLMRSLEDERADVDTLAHHLNADPAIVARLLAAANSCASGLATPCETARQAFMVLGVNRVVGIVLASALIHRYDTRTQEFDARQLWRHTLGVATCARVLAERAGLNPEIAFTAGLLHDIGQLLMVAAAPAAYDQVLQLLRSEGKTILAAEHAVFGFDHAAAGGVLAQAWRLPHEIGEAIAAHHEPDAFGNELGDLVHVSDVLSHALDLGEQPNNQVPGLSERACANLGLSWPDFAGRFGEIEARYDCIRVALGI